MVSDPRSSAGHGGRSTTALPPAKSSLLNPTASPSRALHDETMLARTYSLHTRVSPIDPPVNDGPSSSSRWDGGSEDIIYKKAISRLA